MAFYYNKVLLAGNLTRDPELRYTPSGTPVTNFGLAVNRRFKSKTGEDVEETCFVEIVVFGKTAEICNEHLVKGRNVFVEGRLKFESWETDIGRRTRHVVVAESVKFLDIKGEKSQEDIVKPDISDVDLGEEDDEFPF